MKEPIRSSLLTVMNEYLVARTEKFSNHPLGHFVRKEIPNLFKNLSFINDKKYIVKASVGKGNWTYVPWIAIMDRDVTKSTQEGFYIVYLFREDMKAVYLTLAQGVTKTSKAEIAKIKEEIRGFVQSSKRINKDDHIFLGNSDTAMAYAYSTAIYIEYSSDQLPSEELLQEDLKEMLNIYEKYKNYVKETSKKKKGKGNQWFLEKIIEALEFFGGSAHLKEINDYFDKNYGDELTIYKDWPAIVRQQIYLHSSDADKVFKGVPGDENDIFYSVKGKGKGFWGLRKYKQNENEMNVIKEEITDYLSYSELVNHIHQYIQSKGFLYSFEEVANLFLSFKTKPFVILSGISGTGKTKMVQWFAESVGATDENGQFTLIPVRPDWNDSSDLLGYVDIQGDFKEGPLTKVIKQAVKEPYKPFIVLLDEMNLARVEYYFSDLLSVMESRKWVDGEIVSSPLLTEEMAGYELIFPNNLYIIGTVNMDETTYPFSKKVLDRANTIEFNRVDLENLDFLKDLNKKDPLKITNHYLKPEYLHLKDVYEKHPNVVREVTKELVKINKILEAMYAHVGYRVRDEICFYLAYNEEAGLLDFNQALDFSIRQKILPRLSGSDRRIDQVLKDLYRLFTNKEFDEALNDYEHDIEMAKYPESAKKVLEMIRRLEEDGFTSFWIS